jgi:hypothetical protein
MKSFAASLRLAGGGRYILSHPMRRSPIRQPPLKRPLAAAGILSAVLLLSQLLPAPPLADPSGAPLPEGLHLTTPTLYLVLAPFFTLWDGIAMLGQRRLIWLPIGLLILYAGGRAGRILWRRHAWSAAPVRRISLWREARVLAAIAAVLLVFIILGAVWRRPMRALAGTGRDVVVVDVHSHTDESHDVAGTPGRGFDVAASRRWHRRAGFHAFFVTDHNTTAGWTRAAGDSLLRPAACPGVELSAGRANIVLLGATPAIAPRHYDGSLDGVLSLIQDADSLYGAVSVASMPEFERQQWAGLESFVGAGLDGFEIAGPSWAAYELTPTRRDAIVALARRSNLFLAGVSATRGWGATSMAWSLVRAPGWKADGDICGTVLQALRADRADRAAVVRVVERHRLSADAWWPLWLTPVGLVWETWRSMGPALAASWLAWIWLAASVIRRDRRNARR